MGSNLCVTLPFFPLECVDGRVGCSVITAAIFNNEVHKKDVDSLLSDITINWIICY